MSTLPTTSGTRHYECGSLESDFARGEDRNMPSVQEETSQLLCTPRRKVCSQVSNFMMRIAEAESIDATAKTALT